jgi:hypothetical protein
MSPDLAFILGVVAIVPLWCAAGRSFTDKPWPGTACYFIVGVGLSLPIIGRILFGY